jgi:hypothetical protein
MPKSGQALGETLDLYINFLTLAPVTINFETDQLPLLSQSDKITNVWGRPATPVYLEKRTRVEALLASLSTASTSFKDDFLLRGNNPEKRLVNPAARPVYGTLQLTVSRGVSLSGTAPRYGVGAFF